MAKKWVDKVINISRVRIIVNKVFVQEITFSLISDLIVYSQQLGLYYSQKDDFYDSLNNIVRKLGEK